MPDVDVFYESKIYRFETRGVVHDALVIGGPARELSVAITTNTNGGVKIVGHVTPEFAAYVADLQKRVL